MHIDELNSLKELRQRALLCAGPHASEDAACYEYFAQLAARDTLLQVCVHPELMDEPEALSEILAGHFERHLRTRHAMDWAN